MAAGHSWRQHCWRQARQSLLPVLPIEVLRNRVKRAAELGLDYRSYASIRAQTGHDVIGFLFSSSALQVTAGQPTMPEARQIKLALVEARKIGLAVAPLQAQLLQAANHALDTSAEAPWALAGWSQARAQIRAALAGLQPDRVVLIGAHGLEADWCAAGRLAGYLPDTRYFGA